MLLGGIEPKLWNWGRTVMSSVQGFVPDAGGFWYTSPKAFSPEHSLVLSCAQVFLFWCLIWFSYSFDQTTKSLYDLLFRPFCALVFLMLISVFASMSTSLSSFQYLHVPYPIFLLSGFWCLASAYFYELHFPLVQFLVYSLSWLAPIWLVHVVSKN